MTAKMIVLELYLDGKLLGSVYPSQILPGIEFSKHLKSLMEELLRKHKETLSGSAEEPVFTLSGLPSLMNNFTPLRH